MSKMTARQWYAGTFLLFTITALQFFQAGKWLAGIGLLVFYTLLVALTIDWGDA